MCLCFVFREMSDSVSSCSSSTMVTLNMVKSSEESWWQYRVHFDDNGHQIFVEIEDKTGIRSAKGTLWIVKESVSDNIFEVKLFTEDEPEKPHWVKKNTFREFERNHWITFTDDSVRSTSGTSTDQSSRSTSASTDKSSLRSMSGSTQSAMITVKQMQDCWKLCYGEDMIQEYSGFFEKLIKNEKM